MSVDINCQKCGGTVSVFNYFFSWSSQYRGPGSLRLAIPAEDRVYICLKADGDDALCVWQKLDLHDI